MEKEIKIHEAIAGYLGGSYSSIRAAAAAFSIPYSTLRHRLAGRKSRSKANEIDQNEVEQRLGLSQICTPAPANDSIADDMPDASIFDLPDLDPARLHTENLKFIAQLDSSQSVDTSLKRHAEIICRQSEHVLRKCDMLRDCRNKLIKELDRLNRLESDAQDMKARRNIKRVASEGKSIYTTDDAIRVIRKAEATQRRKQPRRKAKRRQVDQDIRKRVGEDLKTVASDSEDDTIIVRYMNRD
ncbi:hypothetical protein K431DRAFT_307675 [Polychaeton citri CBS 116435]|uniref:HTH psq-type domain-containing protein n=1 Tax=Polychaeton citri CBS 116435 TaxID=1314669 RepID=A0A9P4PX56_9PEZI|nr:hypothetical protein K431DRAFT_307675 [Polychaeton citri CBS 116435]